MQISSFEKKRTFKAGRLERKNNVFPERLKGYFKKNIWTEGISFCFDEVGCQYKYNPFDEAKSLKSMSWRQRSES